MRQDGVADTLEGLGDERGADRPRGLTAAQREHAPAKARGYRRGGQQVAREVKDVLEIVLVAHARHGIGNDGLAILRAQADGAADAGVHAVVFGQRRGDHTMLGVRLDEHGRIIRRPADHAGADVERGMRPGGLGQVLDGGADPAVALHEQDVAGAQGLCQSLGGVGGGRPVGGHLGIEVARNQPADTAQDPVCHEVASVSGTPAHVTTDRLALARSGGPQRR